MSISILLLVIAVVLFFLGMTSRWWPVGPAPNPYYPSIISAGLFFYTLSVLWPMISK